MPENVSKRCPRRSVGDFFDGSWGGVLAEGADMNISGVLGRLGPLRWGSRVDL